MQKLYRLRLDPVIHYTMAESEDKAFQMFKKKIEQMLKAGGLNHLIECANSTPEEADREFLKMFKEQRIITCSQEVE